MTNFLHGVAIANYKGYGPEINFIGPFARFNFFIGANNSGKSSVLEMLVKHLQRVMTPQPIYSSTPRVDFDPADRHTSHPSNSPLVAMGFVAEELMDVLERIAGTAFDYKQVKCVAEEILLAYSRNQLVWVTRNEKGGFKAPIESMEPNESVLMAEGRLRAAQRLRTIINSHHGGGSTPKQLLDELKNTIINNINTSLPPISLIPAIREISAKGEDFIDWSGRGLIEELMEHQAPDHGQREKSLKFEAINKFVRNVTNNESAKIRIPKSLQDILVEIDGKELPLKKLGTGIHEVIILASCCTMVSKQIVCIEEPEIHLHPLLQKRLIQYLENNTDNQYVIATHSASILDSVKGAVFHVGEKDSYSWVRSAASSAERFEICRDLGYKASDLLQSNCIIWVEGPSDRIYLNWWLGHLEPDLREGIDYSIMFYGGRLLSHLTGAEEAVESEVQALIELRKLNRNCCVVIDSDKKNEDDVVNATKRRIVDEFREGRGMTWVTSGREIENYIQPENLSEALANVYPTRYGSRYKTGKFDNVLPFRRSDGSIQKEVDKVGVARYLSRTVPDFTRHDLQARLNELAGLIRKAN